MPATIKSRTQTQRVLTGLGVVVVLLCAVVACLAAYIRHEMNGFIEDVRQLDTVADPAAYFASFKREHRRQFLDEQCDSRSCYDEFVVTNKILSTFRLAPRTERTGRFALNHGLPGTAGIQFTSAIFDQNSPTVYIQEDFCGDKTDKTCQQFGFDPHGRNATQTWNGLVELGQRATTIQRETAWAINAQCLMRLNGRRDISQKLPTIWKTTKPGTVSSRVPSDADSIAEQPQPCQSNTTHAEKLYVRRHLRNAPEGKNE
jgi:hypothetical protein